VCTLTIVPAPGNRVRLAFNRDEQRTRAPGLPPGTRRFGDRIAALPTDPDSGGTWLAVNDDGLALALLNVNPASRGREPKPGRSRGEVIPTLVGADSPSTALTVAERDLDYHTFAPFRLVLIGQGVIADVQWDGREPMVMSRLVGGSPLMFTSSGLGDHLVEGVRRELFDDLFSGSSETWEAAQDTFHRYRWPGREHLSVNMSRADARTVSFSAIDIGKAEAVFAYHPDSPDATAELVKIHLPLRTTGAA
jgi:hypothetical protein